MKHFNQQENQYIAKLIKKAKAKERARIIMNNFTPGQRSEIARLIKKAKAKQIEEMIKNINKLKKKPGHSLDHQDYYYQAINDAIAILKD